MLDAALLRDIRERGDMRHVAMPRRLRRHIYAYVIRERYMPRAIDI